MQIEIHGEAEQLLKSVLASGQFATVDDFITTMAKQLKLSDATGDLVESYAAQSEVASLAGWDDAEMDKYDDYDAHKKRP